MHEILVIGGILLLGGVFCELFLGLVYCTFRNGRTWYALARSSVYQFDSRTGYSYRPSLTYSNPTKPLPNAPRRILYRDHRTGPDGFLFCERIADISQDYKLIFCLGGSTTAGGFESRYDLSYPAQLDRLVRPLGYRAINAGLGGGRSIHEVLLLKERILRYSPHTVILFSGYNDFEDPADFPAMDSSDPFSHCLSRDLPRSTLRQAMNGSALARYIFRAWDLVTKDRARAETASPDQIAAMGRVLDDGGWLGRWRAHAIEMAQLCSAQGAQLRILSHASPVFPGARPADKELADRELNMVGRYDLFLRYLNDIEQVSREVCAQTDARFLDVCPMFEAECAADTQDEAVRKRYAFFVDRMHFSDVGNEMIARCIFDALKGEL